MSMTRRNRRYLPLVVLIIVLAIAALWLLLGQGGGGGGGPTVTQTPGPGSSGVTEWRLCDVPSGVNLIYIPSWVTYNGTAYVFSATLAGPSVVLVAYGGSSVNTALQYGNPYVDIGSDRIYLVGVASKNGTAYFDCPGVKARLDANGGYILYNGKHAVYYVHESFNTTAGVVHVWTVAPSYPSLLVSNATNHIVMTQYGVQVNGVPYQVGLGTYGSAKTGVLKAWVVYAESSGTYTFTINP